MQIASISNISVKIIYVLALNGISNARWAMGYKDEIQNSIAFFEGKHGINENFLNNVLSDDDIFISSFHPNVDEDVNNAIYALLHNNPEKNKARKHLQDIYKGSGERGVINEYKNETNGLGDIKSRLVNFNIPIECFVQAKEDVKSTYVKQTGNELKEYDTDRDKLIEKKKNEKK